MKCPVRIQYFFPKLLFLDSAELRCYIFIVSVPSSHGHCKFQHNIHRPGIPLYIHSYSHHMTYASLYIPRYRSRLHLKEKFHNLKIG